MSEKYECFIKLLKEIFEIDKSDLDFGIYRILNLRKDKISNFLQRDLQLQVMSILKNSVADDKKIEEEIKELEKQSANLGVDIENSQKYKGLKAILNSGRTLSDIESDVYSALYNFFNRYYDEGDFISKRRYEEGVYAIPYEGEEVKLY